MLKSKLISALFLMAMSFMSYGQETSGKQSTPVETKVIAVVNRANWCGVCKANGARLGNNIMPYSTKGLTIVMNDLTDETTIAKSKADLEKSALYKQIYKSNRKGVGRMMQVCGIIHGKDKQMASGITDAEMKTIIDSLLKS